MVQEIAASRLAAFGWLDVLVSAVVVLQLAASESSKLGMRRLWLPVVGTLTVGVSLGLPLFLWLRERHLEMPKGRTC